MRARLTCCLLTLLLLAANPASASGAEETVHACLAGAAVTQGGDPASCVAVHSDACLAGATDDIAARDCIWDEADIWVDMMEARDIPIRPLRDACIGWLDQTGTTRDDRMQGLCILEGAAGAVIHDLTGG